MLHSSGVGVYIKQIIHELVTDSNENVTLIINETESVEGIPEDIQIIKVNYGRFSIKNIFKLRKLLINYDCYLIPNLALTPFKSKKYKIFSTVHDLCPVRMRDCFPLHLSIAYWVLMLWQIINSNKIFTISGFTKKELKCFYPFFNENKYVVVHNGWEKKNENITFRGAEPSEIYGLCVGNVKKHKNILPLIDYLNNCVPDTLIYIVGDYSNFKTKAIADDPVSTKSIVFTGFISDEELDNLYKNASFFIFPSRYEGFGLPLLEAMAYQLPIFASNIEIFHEIAGEHIEYFDPHDFDGLNKMISSVQKKDLRKDYSDVLKKFSWKKTVNSMLKVMNEYSFNK
ncbi:glycosyltransferase family 1 protein [Escherichia coli]|nr:glycosyltransferase family 1 protein [Escherichia coli]UMR66127.1 glycosyltransferase family 1 protein [Escherichia coli]